MDRVRNAGHFAARIQRWLSGIGGAIRAPTLRQQMTALKINGLQLDLFGPEHAVALTPTVVTPPAPLPFLKPVAPPRIKLPTLPAPPIPPAPEAPPKRQLQIGQHTLDYALRRSTRRSIGFMIDDDGLRVTAPKRVSIAEIDNAIRAKQGWILSKLRERFERREQRLQTPPLKWIDGAILPFLGGSVTLRLQAGARARTSYDQASGELMVQLPPDSTEHHLKERVRSWLQLEAKRLFAERLALYADKLGVTFHSFALSSAGTRWGSCTVQRKIRLNWRLVHFTLPLIDYVVAHELAHLREMNHSARFWATVETIYPDYAQAKLALRKRAQELPVLFS